LTNLGAAVREIHTANRAATVASRDQHQARAGIVATDALLSIIEERHLKGARKSITMRGEWRSLLEGAGLTVPADIRDARSTVELHARLLVWQEELLSHLDPNRSAELLALDGPEVEPPRSTSFRPRRSAERSRRGAGQAATSRRARLW
jgi:hypothetical protein